MNLDHITIVLVETQIPENIGSAARAMHNMGFRHLTLVAPKNCDLSRVLKMATGTSIDVIEEMEVYDDLRTALGPYHHVIGTTARIGSHRPATFNLRRLVHDLAPIVQNNRIAILFGPEDRGLSNGQLHHCHTIARIPTAEFSSQSRPSRHDPVL